MLWVLVAVLAAATASGQESLQTAKDLYASAAYEDALAVLARLQRADAPLEVQQYRAFCLIALGRADEAQQAIEQVVTANPRYVPAAMDISPRIQEAFTRTRTQLLPQIARQLYVDAKRALDRKDSEAAEKGFAAVIELIDGADGELREALDELRFLAVGFRDLSLATHAPPPSAASPALDPAPVRPVHVTPAVALRQVMPPWIPADSAGRQSYSGAIRVSISANGRVEDVFVVRPSHPAYDRLLLPMAMMWEYLPARRDGIAIPSEQVVEVQLKPKQ
jgi:tetratricopeptide (TPR) repeat protein